MSCRPISSSSIRFASWKSPQRDESRRLHPPSFRRQRQVIRKRHVAALNVAIVDPRLAAVGERLSGRRWIDVGTVPAGTEHPLVEFVVVGTVRIQTALGHLLADVLAHLRILDLLSAVVLP